jgi:hypothetical protein
MPDLHLNDDEARVLKELLRHKLDALDIEICHTDHADFRNSLKERRKLLENLCSRIPEPPDTIPQI